MKRLSARSAYEHDVFLIKKYGDGDKRIIYCSSLRVSGWEYSHSPFKFKLNNTPQRCSVNDEKLDNNLSRAKSTFREKAKCNEWWFWVTLTFSPVLVNDRYNLEETVKPFLEWIHNYNRRSNIDEKVIYLLVPELCYDGAFHLHGFIKGIRKNDLFINEHGHLDWKSYREKFGWIELTDLRKMSEEYKSKKISYCTKYMSKSCDLTIKGLNKHCFYASKGLKKAEIIYRGQGEFLGDEYTWEDEEGYVKFKDLTKSQNIDDWFKKYDFSDSNETDVNVVNNVLDDFISDIGQELVYIGSDQDGFMYFLDQDTGEVVKTDIGINESVAV